jgi:4-carboxymuconolactone decarboxylase
MDESLRHRLGDAKRREVLGAAHVDRAAAKRTAFDEEFQELLTRHAWGEIWTRPGLPEETRRLLVLTTTIALNRRDEFKLHCRAALEAGVSLDAIKEVLLQSAVYCGLPAANNAFHDVAEVRRSLEGGET